MGLLKNLIARIKHKFKPNYSRGVFYKVIPVKNLPAFEVLVGPNRGAKFTFTDIQIDDGGKCSVDITHIQGNKASEKEINEVFVDFLKEVVENHNDLRHEVINDNTEDSGTDFVEEPLEERGIHAKSSTVPKE